MNWMLIKRLIHRYFEKLGEKLDYDGLDAFVMIMLTYMVFFVPSGWILAVILECPFVLAFLVIGPLLGALCSIVLGLLTTWTFYIGGFLLDSYTDAKDYLEAEKRKLTSNENETTEREKW